MNLTLDSPVRYVPRVGPVMAKKLEKLEVLTVADLLYHIPFRYNDYSLTSPIEKLQPGETVTIHGEVVSMKNIFTKSGKKLQQAVISDNTGSITATWFNQPFLINTIKPGISLYLSGKVDWFGHTLVLNSPEYEIFQTESGPLHTGRLVPVYPETQGVSSKWLRSRIAPLLQLHLVKQDFLPEEIRKSHQLLDLSTAFGEIHFPSSLLETNRAKKRLAFDELFLLQLAASIRRRTWHAQKITKPFAVDEEKVLLFLNSLPFTLTSAQKRSLKEILGDLQKFTPMNRLLEGDVGSGKTVVAAIAAYIAYLNNAQTLFMAPTEILAEQHFETLSKLLIPFGMKIGLQTGSQKIVQPLRSSPLTKGRSGRVNSLFNVLVGTHALIEKKVTLPNVGLVIIDEQHRFGVKQRALLREKGTAPHLLTMTATPIPRTIVLTLYGDLDLSVINELPKNRLPVKTWIVPQIKRLNCYAWIAKRIAENPEEAAYIVCPFIEPSESLQTIRAATAEFHRLQRIFSHLKLGLLHGKMKIQDKQGALADFKNGITNILVCTPVVEVGIDISRATIMLIEAAERFGLAQLHQLRGRVGRGKNQAYCFLFTSDGSKTSMRLKALENTYDGLKLAEVDLAIRGPGEVYGVTQHGRMTLKIASFSDLSLIEQVKGEAEKLLAVDPDLTQNPLLKGRVTSVTIHQVSPD